MNRIYKVIWSKTRNCYVVVSELAKQHTKSSSGIGSAMVRGVLAGAVLLSLTAGMCAPVWAENYTAPSSATAGGDGNTAVGPNSKAGSGYNNVAMGAFSSAGKASHYTGSDRHDALMSKMVTYYGDWNKVIAELDRLKQQEEIV